MDLLRLGLDDFRQLARKNKMNIYDEKDDVMSVGGEAQFKADFIKKYVREIVPEQKISTLFQTIILPVLIMIFACSRTDGSFMMKATISFLVVLHIILASKITLTS